ncbi:MAG TPA: hypothetical protein VF037_08495 [Gemmatimonadales bacterium]
MRLPSLLVAAMLAVAACEPAPPPPDDPPAFGEAFQDLPLPANGQVVSRSGSQDALQIVIDVPASQEAVAEMYRQSLARAPWRLVSDSRDSAGTLLLYAEGKRPLWVRIAENPGGATRVELNGAAPGRDQDYMRRREAAADTTNTMRPRSLGAPK